MDAPQQYTEQDPVLQFLLSIHLANHESDIRGVIHNVAEDPDRPKIRDIVIATVAVLMSVGGIGWPIVMRVISHLGRMEESALQEAAIAIVNGSHLLLPDGDNTVTSVDVITLRESDSGPAFVSTIYSLTSIWQQAVKVLGT